MRGYFVTVWGVGLYSRGSTTITEMRKSQQYLHIHKFKHITPTMLACRNEHLKSAVHLYILETDPIFNICHNIVNPLYPSTILGSQTFRKIATELSYNLV